MLPLVFGLALAQYKIGSHLPLTGSLSRIGTEMANGVRLAVEHFNATAPFKVELVLLDDESSPAKAVAAVERLVGRERVLGITGGYGSNIIGPASEVAERARVPYITSGGLTRDLTQRGFRYFFRFTNVEGYAVVAADLIAQGFRAKRVALAHDDGAGGTDVARAVRAKLQALGLQLVFDSSYPGRSTDLKPLLEQIGRSGAEVLIFIGYENNYATALRGAQVVRPKVNAFVGLYSLITPSLIQDLGPLMEGVYGTEPWTNGSAPVALRAEEARFVRDYRGRFGQTPGYLAALGYVQTQILLNALKKAVESGSPTPEAVRDALATSQGETLVSAYRFDEKGDNVLYRTVVSQVQKGRGVPVWPKERAYGRWVYPQVPWTR